MAKLEAIATIATLAVGGLIFIKAWPAIEGFLGGAGGIGGAIQDFFKYEGPLRTYEPVLEARPVLTEATAVVPGTDFPVSPQRLEYQEAIGVPILTAEEYAKLGPKPDRMPTPEEIAGFFAQAEQPPVVEPSFVTEWKAGEISMPAMMAQIAEPEPPIVKSYTWPEGYTISPPAPEPNFRELAVLFPAEPSRPAIDWGGLATLFPGG